MKELKELLRAYFKTIYEDDRDERYKLPSVSPEKARVLFKLSEEMYGSGMLSEDAKHYLLVSRGTLKEYVRAYYDGEVEISKYNAIWREINKAKRLYDQVLRANEDELSKVEAELYQKGESSPNDVMANVVAFPFGMVREKWQDIDGDSFNHLMQDLVTLLYADLLETEAHLSEDIASYVKFLYVTDEKYMDEDERYHKEKLMKALHEPIDHMISWEQFLVD